MPDLGIGRARKEAETFSGGTASPGPARKHTPGLILLLSSHLLSVEIPVGHAQREVRIQENTRLQCLWDSPGVEKNGKHQHSPENGDNIFSCDYSSLGAGHESLNLNSTTTWMGGLGQMIVL